MKKFELKTRFKVDQYEWIRDLLKSRQLLVARDNMVFMNSIDAILDEIKNNTGVRKMKIINIIKNKKTQFINIVKKNRFLSFAIWVMIFTCLILGQQGCAYKTKTVLYQMASPYSNMTYSWEGNPSDEPLSFREWLEIIRNGRENGATPKEEKEL